MTESARERKRERDRKRYRRKADELRKRQREYYAAHRDECIKSVRRSQRAKVIREFNKHFNYEKDERPEAILP